MAAERERVDIDPGHEVSIFELGTSLLRHRWSIARWMILGGAIAFVVVLFKKTWHGGANAAGLSILEDSASQEALSGLHEEAGSRSLGQLS